MANYIKDTAGTRTHRDLDLSFLPNPATGDLRVKTGDDAIKQSVRTLVLSNLGVRPYEEDFGSTVYRSLFENYNSFSAGVLQDRLRELIAKHETRVLAESIDVVFSDNEQVLDVTVSYAIVNGPFASVSISLKKIR